MRRTVIQMADDETILIQRLSRLMQSASQSSLKMWMFEHFEACAKIVTQARLGGTRIHWIRIARDLHANGVCDANGNPPSADAVRHAFKKEAKVRAKAQAAGLNLPGASPSAASVNATPTQQAAQSSPLRPGVVRPVSPPAPENIRDQSFSCDGDDPNYDPSEEFGVRFQLASIRHPSKTK
jgi:hypothetical protein